MKAWLSFALWLAMGAAPCAGEIIDRTVATVNGRVILLSDWDDAVRCEALMDARPLSAVTPEQRQAALQRLVDQELLRQQIGGEEVAPGPDEVSRQVTRVRAQYAAAADPQGWREVLAQYGLTEADVAERIAVQLTTMRFIEHRLRPSVQIEQASVEAYYREKFLPELRRKGGAEVPLAEVATRIRELLAQQRIDELLSAWLQNLRAQSQIRLADAPERQAAEVR